jgi:WD40 repeat protein
MSLMRRAIVAAWGLVLVCGAATVAADGVPRNDGMGDPLPDGAVARLGTVRLRHGHTITSVALSADGQLLAAGGHDDVLRLWDTAEGKLLRTLSAEAAKAPRPGPAHWFYNAALSADGKLAAGCGSDQVLHVWDTSFAESTPWSWPPSPRRGRTWTNSPRVPRPRS